MAVRHDISVYPDGFLKLVGIQHACSRRIAGWVMKKNQQFSLMVKALQMTLLNHNHVGVIHHSEQGSLQFDLQAAFGRRNDTR